MTFDHPIGIFDSGIGGLTVFREIQKLLPHENLIYLGDTARVPYGTKSAATVQRYSRENVRFLLAQNVKMVVVACNTASALALNDLQREWTLPIVGVVKPGAKGAVQKTKTKKIGVIGTEGTIRSGAYEREIKQLDPKAEVVSVACPLFVPFVEEGWLTGEAIRLVTEQYLSRFCAEQGVREDRRNIDTLILGCTHYPLLKPVIKEMMKEVLLIDSAEETAREVFQTLTAKQLLASSTKPNMDFFVTDSPERFRRVGEIFMEESLPHVNQVEI